MLDMLNICNFVYIFVNVLLEGTFLEGNQAVEEKMTLFFPDLKQTLLGTSVLHKV